MWRRYKARSLRPQFVTAGCFREGIFFPWGGGDVRVCDKLLSGFLGLVAANIFVLGRVPGRGPLMLRGSTAHEAPLQAHGPAPAMLAHCASDTHYSAPWAHHVLFSLPTRLSPEILSLFRPLLKHQLLKGASCVNQLVLLSQSATGWGAQTTDIYSLTVWRLEV